MATANSTCPCDWDADFSNLTDCENDVKEGGVESCSVVICYPKISSIAKNADYSAADPDSGQINDITLTAGEAGVRFFSKKKSVLAESTQTVNDNDSVELNEIITGQGKSGPAQIGWLRAHINKDVLRLEVDEGDRIRAYGWDGGLRLSEYTDTTGTLKADFAGVNYTFTNTTDAPFCFVTWDKATYPTAALYLATLI